MKQSTNSSLKQKEALLFQSGLELGQSKLSLASVVLEQGHQCSMISEECIRSKEVYVICRSPYVNGLDCKFASVRDAEYREPQMCESKQCAVNGIGAASSVDKSA